MSAPDVGVVLKLLNQVEAVLMLIEQIYQQTGCCLCP